MDREATRRSTDTKAAIESAGSRLAPSHALALTLEADGASEEHMARALGIPAEAVAPLLHVAHAKLARIAMLVAVFAVTIVAGAARAQVDGTDCGCPKTGAYVSPDPGVAPDGSSVSPGGVFRVEGGQLPGPITVVRQSSGASVLQVQANDWGWSPDGDRIVILSVTGSPPNTSRQYLLYDLAGGPSATPVWSSPSSTLWSSERLRFSEDGAVLLFAALSEVNDDTVELAAFEIATGATLTDSFSFYHPPSNFDDDSDPEVAGWGFGPDPTRIAYGYTTSQGNYTRVLGNARAGVKRGLSYTAIAEVPLFSPCGDVFAEKVQQLATSDDVTVTLYSTADPQANPFANQGFANGVAVEVHASLTDHFGLLGGTEYPIAPNVADDVCAPANVPPAASFTPPVAATVGQPAAFTDTSSDADGTIIAWSWDFGAGGSSSTRDPSHVFAAAGVYSVTLTVTDDDGATDTITREVQVCEDFDDASGALLYSIDAGLYGDVFNRDLFAYDAATHGVAQLTDSDWDLAAGDPFVQFGGGGTGAGARRSPDGTRIAFAPYSFGEAGIWVMDTDGGNRRRLTDGDGSNGDFDFHHNPAWSPDGVWIVFENGDFTGGTDATGLYMVRADGTGLVKIPGTIRYNPIADGSPDFFPTIEPACAGLAPAQRGPGCYRIAFVRNPFTQPFTDTIRSVRGDGSDPQVLVPELGSYRSVRVAPGGSRIAIARERYSPPNGDVGIYVLDLPASEPQRRVTDTSLWADFPVWSPDGRFVAFRGHVPGTPEYDALATDLGGCPARALRAQANVEERPEDWSVGAIAQAPVRLAGYVTGASWLVRYGGITVAISGDASASATSAADGSFVFENLPAGGIFSLSIVSAPGFVFDPTPVPITLGGNAVGAQLRVYPDEATLHGTVLFEGTPLEGMVIRAEGPGGPFEATTDASGAYSITTRRDQTYTISGRKPGYRLDPATRSVWVGSQLSLDLVAVAAPELPPGRIAFTSTRDGNEEIYLLDLASGVQTNLTNDPESDREPAWSPDGSRIAFASTRNFGSLEIYVMDADGSNVAPAGIWGGFEPAWSPDGEWLAFATGAGIGFQELATGVGWTATTDPSDHSPRWRTDGSRRIVFERTVETNGELESDLFEVDVSDPFGPVESPVVEQPGDDLDPAFSAESAGSRLAYATADGDATNDVGIRAESASGSDAASPGRNPSWSPDGRFVVYDDAGSLRVFEPGSGNAPVAASETGTDSDPDWKPASPSSQPACDNGIDDDGDGLVDMDDPGCPFPFASPENPPCDDGIDDDGNGLTDFDDPKCTPEWPYWERPPACGLGGELVLVYAAVAAARRRDARPRRAG